MSFEKVETLKKQYTDKWVEVDSSVPELRRFKGLTGQVKTVNMSGRALVQFEHPVDISWYDIEPSYLKVVDKPVKKEAPGKHAAEGEKKPAAEAKASPAAKPGAAKPAGGKPTGKSPLEMARAQGAAGSGKGTAAAPAPAPAAAAGGKPLSKLEQARLQGAAGAAKAAAPAAAVPATPAGRRRAWAANRCRNSKWPACKVRQAAQGRRGTGCHNGGCPASSSSGRRSYNGRRRQAAFKTRNGAHAGFRTREGRRGSGSPGSVCCGSYGCRRSDRSSHNWSRRQAALETGAGASAGGGKRRWRD